MIPVLQLRSSRGMYGADRAILTLARNLPAPFEPIVGTVARGADGHALSAAFADSVRFESADAFDFQLVPRLAELIRARRVQLVHAHDFKALSLAVAATAISQVPVVATYHGDTGATAKLVAYERVGRVLGNFCSRVAVVSRQLEETLRLWAPRARVERIANGIEAVEPLPPRVGGDFTLAVIGRLSVEKGHAVLFRALRRLATRPKVLVVGDGPLRAELERDAADLPAKFVGYLADTRAAYAECDAVVLPSLTEGLPLVALEAMAYGRRVIASAVGELPQLLTGCGVLVPAGDDRALAKAIERVREDPARQVSSAIRRVREQYSGEAMARGYVEQLYLPALAAQASTGAGANEPAEARSGRARLQR